MDKTTDIERFFAYLGMTGCVILMIIVIGFGISYYIFWEEPDLWKALTGRYPKR